MTDFYKPQYTVATVRTYLGMSKIYFNQQMLRKILKPSVRGTRGKSSLWSVHDALMDKHVSKLQIRKDAAREMCDNLSKAYREGTNKHPDWPNVYVFKTGRSCELMCRLSEADHEQAYKQLEDIKNETTKTD